MARFGFAVVLCALAVAPVATTLAQDLLWARQAGTAESDSGNSVAVDGSGNAYVAGQTSGGLYGTNAGGYDAFLVKYNTSGTVLWAVQSGTLSADFASGVAVDAPGNAYVTGLTRGSLGGMNAGDFDVFVLKYDASGTLIWTRQVGTTAKDESLGVAVNGTGDVYVTGFTSGDLAAPDSGGLDAFLIKYNGSGTLLWKRQFGTNADDKAVRVAVDGAGNAYITGYTDGNLGGTNAGSTDAFLAKYDVDGTPLWTRQTGSLDADFAGGIAVDDAGNAYITGRTSGSLGGPNAGDFDVFLAKYSATGAPLWARQFGTSLLDFGGSVAVDGVRDVFITGYSYGSVGGPNIGETDVFVAKYSTSGTSLWTRQIGTPSFENGYAVAVDDRSDAFVTGTTGGNFGGANTGSGDMFLLKFGPPPCPADFDGNGFVNGDDFDAFVLVFEAGNIAADFDGNGFVNGDDFDGYIGAFEAGC